MSLPGKVEIIYDENRMHVHFKVDGRLQGVGKDFKSHAEAKTWFDTVRKTPIMNGVSIENLSQVSDKLKRLTKPDDKSELPGNSTAHA